MSLLRQDVSWNRYADTNGPTCDPLSIIYNEGLWGINQVTPLHNISYQPVKLKQYAAKVRQALVGIVQANSTKYKVMFEEQPHVRYCEEDASGLVITVTLSTQDELKTKVAYFAILLSWGYSKALDQATHLPYMLERGEQRVGASVRTTLQTLFDCNIRQFSLTQHQLLQLGFSFVDNDSSKSTDQFTLIFKTPNMDKLSLSFDVGDITIIWNGMKDEAAHPSELVNLTYQTLQNQIFSTLGLEITVFEISEVKLSKAEVKSKGMVKMKTPEVVNCVFTVLNEIRHNVDKDFSTIFDKEYMSADE